VGLQQHRAEIEQLFARVEGNGPQTADLVARVRAAMRPVVFIQIAADAQRALAERLKTTLASNGFDVPGIENVGGKSDVPAAAPQVRLQGRSGRAAAQQIAETVHELTGLTPLIQTISKASPKVDTYEVWLDRGTCINQAHRPAACAG
jgi:ABC-type transporter Mla subunit MlaD